MISIIDFNQRKLPSGKARYLERIGPISIFADTLQLLNRDRLLNRLQLKNDVSDAFLIMSLFLKLGDDFVGELLGVFSFVLFDEKKETAYLARDRLGLAPLYYQMDQGVCLIANRVESIISHPLSIQKIDDSLVAEWLITGHVLNKEKTFFSSIKKCPRATLLKVDQKSIAYHVYWDYKNIVPLTYKHEHDYVEHLKSLLSLVIQDRMKLEGASAAHSSGGLDSSVIAIIAGRIAIKNHQAFHTFNWCKPDSLEDPASHEWMDARNIAEAEGFLHHEIGIKAESIVHYLMHHDISQHGTTTFEYEKAVLNQANALGIKQIFSGFGGDEILTSRFKDMHYQDIHKLRWMKVFRRLAMERAPDKRLFYLKVARDFLRTFKNSFFQKNPYTAFNHKRLLLAQGLMKPEFAHFVSSRYPATEEFNENSISDLQYEYLSSGYLEERMETWDQLGSKFGIHYTYPYLDQRIVEFGLSIPSTLYFKHGQSRYLYKKAIQDFIPETLHKKNKPLETNRVKQLIREEAKALRDPQVLDMIAASDSPYIDTHILIKQCREIDSLDLNHLETSIPMIRSMMQATMMLNINKKNI